MQVANWGHIPLVDAAWCLTAARSRLNSLSMIHEGLASALLKRRWAAVRTKAIRRGRLATLRENMVDMSGGFLERRGWEVP